MHPKLIITIIVANKDISRIFHGFLITKTYDFANYELSKSEKPPIWRFLGGFYAVLGCFCRYLAIFLIYTGFHHQKLIISQIMSFQNLKNRHIGGKPPYWRFLNFCNSWFAELFGLVSENNHRKENRLVVLKMPKNRPKISQKPPDWQFIAA